jgi:hypothetical protein
LYGPGAEVARHSFQRVSQARCNLGVIRGHRRTDLPDRVGLLACKLAQQFHVQFVVAADTAEPVRAVKALNRREIGRRDDGVLRRRDRAADRLRDAAGNLAQRVEEQRRIDGLGDVATHAVGEA